MKASIIIPAYNSEEFISETLDSAVAQTIDDFEIICINDGSKDSTIDILREYEQENDNVIVIDKENEGVAAARNDGIKIAKGEFLYFLDADDLLESTALEHMYEKAKKYKADLVIAQYDIFDESRTYMIKDLEDTVLKPTIDKYDLDIINTFSLCNKFFKKEIIDKNDMKIPPLTYSEDGVFTMQFVFNSKTIATLEDRVFHYRRLVDNENSATTVISDTKIADYIEAHKQIAKLAKESLLRDNPKYKTIEEACEAETWIKQYVNAIYGKELRILAGQFYSKYWVQSPDINKKIVEEIKSIVSKLDVYTLAMISDGIPDVTFQNVALEEKEILDSAAFTFAIYGNPKNEEGFVKTMQSVVYQNFIRTKIIVNSEMKEIAKENDVCTNNVFFVDAADKNSFYYEQIKNCDTDYIILGDDQFSYGTSMLKWMFKRDIRGGRDFRVEQVFTGDGNSIPIFANKIAISSVLEVESYNEALSLDNIVANKVFKTDFLKGFDFDESKPITDYVKDFYIKGSFQAYDTELVFFNEDKEEYMKLVDSSLAKKSLEGAFENKPADLRDDELVVNQGWELKKLLDVHNDPNYMNDKKFIKWINKATELPLKDQTLFVTIRKDGELEGNAKALYDHVKGNKKIVAAMLPHKNKDIKKMVMELGSSKVIVTDDYVKYLRYFPLKPEQRFIQLWHACGAFKMFGKHGTNMSPVTDAATHAQYNLVCVSGRAVRPIYADAFEVELKKVKDVGVPRTDMFFDEEYINSVREKVYAKRPNLKDKEVIVYAPTFRDARGGRANFQPELDFERLSKNLKENQVFVVCPHPVMKNDIVDGKYDNVYVERDFSTNDMMLVSDMLITDYSSVIFEYALLNKPIAFFCYDLEKYNRGFYLSYPEDLPGEVYMNQDELEKFITDESLHTISDKHKDFVENYMTGCDGHSTERIAKIINDYFKEK